MSSVTGSVSGGTIGSTWLRAKLQADALLRYHLLPPLLHHVPELLQHWIEKQAIPNEGITKPMLALEMLAAIQDITGIRVGADIHWTRLAAKAVALLPDHVRTPCERYRWLHTHIPLKDDPEPDSTDLLQQVLVSLAFHGKTLLSVPHALAVAQRLEVDDDISASKCFAMYAAHDARRVVSDITIPAGFEVGQVAARLHKVFAHEGGTTQLTHAAYCLGCLGDARKPTVPSVTLPVQKRPDACALVWDYAKQIDSAHETMYTN